MKINNYEENLIEIAWVDQELTDKGKYKDDTDSIDEKIAIIELAKQFEEENRNINWDDRGDYYTTIREFAEKELLKQFGKLPNIIRISFDVDELEDKEDIKEKMAQILENAGVEIYGAFNAARWTHEGYYSGEDPID